MTYQTDVDAEADLDGIYEYSLLNHGLQQADRYFVSLYGCFEMLATHPLVGQDVGHILKGARRHTHKEHVIYYEPSDPLLILRILGVNQDPLRQFSA